MTVPTSLRPRALGTALALGAAMLLVGAASRPAEGQVQRGAPSTVEVGTTVTVVPGPEYAAGTFHRMMFGGNWRSLWTTPVDAQVFGFDQYAGGVEWDRRGGGSQSITLHLDERDGWREYIFRSVNKFPEQALPSDLRGTYLGGVVGDMISAMFPAAPLMVPPLMDAVGLLHVEPVLRVMPDDPRLEVYQDTFAGMLGTVELQANEGDDDQPGFAGSLAVKGTEEFFNDLEAEKAHRLDERAFLTARLVDFLINDTDRTQDNMRWARFGPEGDYVWQPIPTDRDWAFLDARGWTSGLLRNFYPKLAAFGPNFPSLSALTYSAHLLDRRLLQRLTRDDFEAVAGEVQGAVTNEVVEAVIARMPASWQMNTDAPARIREAIVRRRAYLRAIALEFYGQLASDVDVHGTAESDVLTVEQGSDGRVRVFMTWPTDHERAGEAFYDRTFLPSETDEVRIYLAGGDDFARVVGEASSSIVVRVIGGDGDDVLVDSAGGGTHLYDAAGENRIVPTGGTHVSRNDWKPPFQSEGLDLGGERFRDWGDAMGWAPAVDYGDVSGVVIGAGPKWTSYGFRRMPYHWSVGARALYAIGDNSFGAEVKADYRFENSPLSLTLAARGVHFDGFRFDGYGNQAAAAGDAALVRQDRVTVEPAVRWYIGWRAREGGDPLDEAADSATGFRPLVGSLDFGPVVLWTDVRPLSGSTLEEAGAGIPHSLARGGLRAILELDRTDTDEVPRRGWRLKGSVAGYPAAGDPADPFAEVDARASVYVPIFGAGPHLAFRIGGSGVWGNAPVQHSAWIGGRSTLRGYRWQRYRGDAAAFGSAELRIPLTRVNVLARWNLGVFGLADVGRVWYQGASPGGWHEGYGGGVWIDALGTAISAAYAHGEDHRLYLNLGLSY